MSHEGIKFVSEAEARQSERLARELPKEAIDPAKVKVHKTEGTRHGDRLERRPSQLMELPLAARRLPRARPASKSARPAARKPGQPKPAPKEIFALYKAPPLPEKVTPVGRYAISFTWNDGHSSGIYSWDYLRRHCPCEVCSAA